MLRSEKEERKRGMKISGEQETDILRTGRSGPALIPEGTQRSAAAGSRIPNADPPKSERSESPLPVSPSPPTRSPQSRTHRWAVSSADLPFRFTTCWRSCITAIQWNHPAVGSAATLYMLGMHILPCLDDDYGLLNARNQLFGKLSWICRTSAASAAAGPT